jgi:lectin family protein
MRFWQGAGILLVSSLAVGCRFTVHGQPDGSDPDGPDLGVPYIGNPMDGAVANVLDLAVPPLPPDLGQQAGCVHVTDSFDIDPSGRWALAGSASYDATSQALQLTPPVFNQSGSAFWTTALYTPAFDVRFRFRIADGSGGDGMAFVWARAANVGALVPFGNNMPNNGYGLGYLKMNGWAVELDTYANPTIGDPDDNHVALMLTTDGTHLLTGSPPSPPLKSSATSRSAHIRFTPEHVVVEIDGVRVIDAAVPAAAGFTADSYWFGFTGASGGATNRHTIDDLTLIVGPSALCLPP